MPSPSMDPLGKLRLMTIKLSQEDKSIERTRRIRIHPGSYEVPEGIYRCHLL